MKLILSINNKDRKMYVWKKRKNIESFWMTIIVCSLVRAVLDRGMPGQSEQNVSQERGQGEVCGCGEYRSTFSLTGQTLL